MKNNKILILIVVIIAAIFLKLCVFSGYSKSAVAKLLTKNQGYKNFSSTMSFTESNYPITVKYKQKDNLVLYTMNLGITDATIYMDLVKDEAIMKIMNYGIKTSISEIAEGYSVDSLTDTSKQILDTLDDYDYKYIDMVDYHDKKCVHFSLDLKDKKSKKDKDEYLKAEFYVDKVNGTIERIIGYDDKDNKIIDLEITTELNSVKDGDIQAPNLNGVQMINKDALK